MDERKLIEKLQLIEALYSGAATEGEKQAAGNALERIKKRLNQIQQEDPPVEFKFSLDNRWSRKLFLALLRRYDIEPYRYPRQRHTTVMARIPNTFVDETLWPEFQELDKILGAYLDDITNRIISESIYSDSSEAEVVKQLN